MISVKVGQSDPHTNTQDLLDGGTRQTSSHNCAIDSGWTVCNLPGGRGGGGVVYLQRVTHTGNRSRCGEVVKGTHVLRVAMTAGTSQSSLHCAIDLGWTGSATLRGCAYAARVTGKPVV